MEQNRVNYLEQIPPEDWGKTPTCVKKLMEEMALQIKQQEKKLREVLTVQEQLLEKINQTSKNSSLPPSSDLPGVENAFLYLKQWSSIATRYAKNADNCSFKQL